MTNSKSTKRALFSSVLAILVCVAMLVGTTFAWFTDTAKAGVNKIESGKLDVALEMKNSVGEWVNAEGKVLNFVNADGSSDILWEPGATFKTTEFRVVNNGNLALKYKFIISGITGDAKLNEVIDWKYDYIFANGSAATYDLDNLISSTTNTVLKPAGTALSDFEARGFRIVGTMDEDAGNEYQGLSIDGISITVVATQAQYEKDINGNTYDKNATYPEVWDGHTTQEPVQDASGVYHITNAAEFAEYISTFSDLSAPAFRGEYYDAKVVLDCDIDFNGNTIERSSACYFYGQFDGQNHTISNFTMKHIGVDGFTSLFGAFDSADACVKNLTVKDATVIGGAQTALIGTVYSGTIDNCRVYDSTIVGEKKVGAIAAYVQSNGTIKNCAAENCNIYCSDTRNNQATVYGFDNGGTFTNNAEPVNCVVKSGVNAVSSDTELKNAVAANTTNVNIVLMSDFTASADWTPIDIGFYGDYSNVTNLTINGNGHTISGLNSALVEKISANCSLTISNLTVKSATINNSSYTNGLGNGILIGYVENGNITLNNCHVVDSSITESSVATAALIGYASGNNQIKITDCTVKNTAVVGDSAAGFIGYVQQQSVTVSGCKVTGSTFTGEKTAKQGAYFGTVNIGTVANISNTTADTTALVGRILSTGVVNYN